MKLMGSVIVEYFTCFLLIRYTTVSSVIGGYLALWVVARADTLLSGTLPSTKVDGPIKIRRNQTIADDIEIFNQWRNLPEEEKFGFFKTCWMTLLLIFNRAARFLFITVYYYFMPFFCLFAADVFTRPKDIEGEFVAPASS